LYRGCDREVSDAGDNEPTGFILIAVLDIVGAFVATYLGQALGLYRPGEGARLIGAVVGAITILLFMEWWLAEVTSMLPR